MPWEAMSPRAMQDGVAILNKYCKTAYGYDVNQDENYNDQKKNRTFTDKLKRIYEATGMKYLLLMMLLSAYGLLGGLMFNAIEKQAEIDEIQSNRNTHFRLRLELIDNLTITYSALLNITQMKCDESCALFLEQVIKEYDSQTGLLDLEELPAYNWNDLWTAAFYAGTLFTTIGYGNMSCRTRLGKAATILYSLIGIPLMLMVLNQYGDVLFRGAQAGWYSLLKFARSRAGQFWRRIRRENYVSESKDHPSPVPMELRDDYVEEEELVNKLEDSVPLSLALAVVVMYTFFCAAVFKLWETDWSYFEAFYFFFISLSTIGLGDQVPAHPKYAISAFLLFVIGLSLVSMCVSIIGARIEQRYMAALQMVEKQAAEEAQQLASAQPSPLHLSAPPNKLHNDTDRPSKESAYDNLPHRSPSMMSAGAYRPRRAGSFDTQSINSQMDMPPAVLGILRAQRIRRSMNTSMSGPHRSSTVSTGEGVSMPRTPRVHRQSEMGDLATPMVIVEETDEDLPQQTRL